MGNEEITENQGEEKWENLQRNDLDHDPVLYKHVFSAAVYIFYVIPDDGTSIENVVST